MTLVIDCCLRGKDSATRKLYESYLNNLIQDEEIKIIKLEEENSKPYTLKDIKERDTLLSNQNFHHERFEYARDFRDADRIIIAAPYWDLSFPSLLKVYIEHIMAAGITFGYEDFIPVGYSKADELIYFTTVGGFLGDNNLGADYIKAIGQMLGIDNFKTYTIEGLDIDPSKREELVQEGIQRMLKENN